MAPNKMQKIANIIYSRGESILNDEDVDFQVCLEIAEDIMEQEFPKYKMTVEEDIEENTGDALLYIMLISPNEQNNINLRESFFTIEDMTVENYDDFLQEAKELAEIWKVDLYIQVIKDDYFTDEDQGLESMDRP